MALSEGTHAELPDAARPICQACLTMARGRVRARMILAATALAAAVTVSGAAGY
jgi:hypothetical protein